MMNVVPILLNILITETGVFFLLSKESFYDPKVARKDSVLLQARGCGGWKVTQNPASLFRRLERAIGKEEEKNEALMSYLCPVEHLLR